MHVHQVHPGWIRPCADSRFQRRRSIMYGQCSHFGNVIGTFVPPSNRSSMWNLTLIVTVVSKGTMFENVDDDEI